MNSPLTPEENRILQSILRPDEEILWQGRGTPNAPAPAKQPTGFLQRLRAMCGARTLPPQQTLLYMLTPKRVLQVQDGAVVQEWPLMLGMVQKVEAAPDGAGSIVFDYVQPTGSTESQACGILHVADVAAVHAKLAAAIDAAYLASPWT